MKKLLILLLLTSCGSVEIPLFEQHLGEDDHKDPAPQAMIHSSKPLLCSQEAFNFKCTNYVVNRILTAQELFSHQCHISYRSCLVRRY